MLEILLSLSLLVHGIQDGLTLGLVPLPQLINLPLHLLVQCGHALVQLLVRQVLQLQARWGVRENIAEMKEGGGVVAYKVGGEDKIMMSLGGRDVDDKLWSRADNYEG